MREKGWQYCSGNCRQQQYGDILKRLKEPHWHRTYETDEGKTIIDLDYLYDINGTIYGNPLISDAVLAEHKYCFDNHLCWKCKRQIGKEDFYGVNVPNSPHWCTECGKGYVLRQSYYNKEGKRIGSKPKVKQ